VTREDDVIAVAADQADRRRTGSVESFPSAGTPTNLLARAAPRVGLRVVRDWVGTVEFEAHILDQVAAKKCLHTAPVRRALDLVGSAHASTLSFGPKQDQPGPHAHLHSGLPVDVGPDLDRRLFRRWTPPAGRPVLEP